MEKKLGPGGGRGGYEVPEDKKLAEQRQGKDKVRRAKGTRKRRGGS